MERFIAQIGRRNLKLVKSLDIWVPDLVEDAPWVRLFNTLANEANGLRNIKLGWGLNYEESDFVRALGHIQNLDKLVITGYYEKHVEISDYWGASLWGGWEASILAEDIALSLLNLSTANLLF
jgi:hypothetical protein